MRKIDERAEDNGGKKGEQKSWKSEKFWFFNGNLESQAEMCKKVETHLLKFVEPARMSHDST